MSELLTDAVKQYSLTRGLSDSAEYQMGRAIRIFGEFLERPATTDDLYDELVSRLIE